MEGGRGSRSAPQRRGGAKLAGVGRAPLPSLATTQRAQRWSPGLRRGRVHGGPTRTPQERAPMSTSASHCPPPASTRSPTSRRSATTSLTPTRLMSATTARPAPPPRRASIRCTHGAMAIAQFQVSAALGESLARALTPPAHLSNPDTWAPENAVHAAAARRSAEQPSGGGGRRRGKAAAAGRVSAGQERRRCAWACCSVRWGNTCRWCCQKCCHAG